MAQCPIERRLKCSQYANILFNKVFALCARKAEWKSLADVRISFASADKVDDLLIFNVAHNHYRLIVRVDFTDNVMFFKGIITHKEYDRSEWKKWK